MFKILCFCMVFVGLNLSADTWIAHKLFSLNGTNTISHLDLRPISTPVRVSCISLEYYSFTTNVLYVWAVQSNVTNLRVNASFTGKTVIYNPTELWIDKGDKLIFSNSVPAQASGLIDYSK